MKPSTTFAAVFAAAVAVVHLWLFHLRDVVFPVPFVDLNSLSGPKLALVTGGTRGIGFEYSVELAKRGFGVYITGTTKEGVDAAVAKLKALHPGTQFVGLVVDVADSKATMKTIRSAFEKNLPQMILLNAAFELVVPSVTLSPEILAEMLEANVISSTAIVQWFMQRLIDTKRKGIIFGISSIANPFPIASADAYSASRAYQTRYYELVQQYCEKHFPHQIRVVVVETGIIATETAKRAPKELLEQSRYIIVETNFFVKYVLAQALDYNQRYVIGGGAFRFLLTLSKFGIGIPPQEMPLFDRDRKFVLAQYVEQGHRFHAQLQGA